MLRGDTHCELLLSGDGRHLKQVVTGFHELAAAGVITLKAREYHATRIGESAVVRALVDGLHVLYDEGDGSDPRREVQDELDVVDHYFKRTLDRTLVAAWPTTMRVWPLGLNYAVTSPSNSWSWGTRPLHARRLAKSVTRRVTGVASRAGIRDRRILEIRDFEWLPIPSEQPTALFMTRTWWPQAGASDSAFEESAKRNETRAACIRAARREFGSRFYGGFADDEFARREYGDCLVTEGAGRTTRELLRRARAADICVTTTGLQGAIGWKMAEYVASSRAIVSESVVTELPGGFSAGVNYLEFTTVDGFVAAVDRLLSDATLRLAMMRANWSYYHSWVRPDALVLNTLLTVLGDATED